MHHVIMMGLCPSPWETGTPHYISGHSNEHAEHGWSWCSLPMAFVGCIKVTLLHIYVYIYICSFLLSRTRTIQAKYPKNSVCCLAFFSLGCPPKLQDCRMHGSLPLPSHLQSFVLAKLGTCIADQVGTRWVWEKDKAQSESDNLHVVY